MRPTANWGWHGAEEPEGWSKGKRAFFRERSDFLLRDIVPSMSTVLGGAPCTSNSLGMRDREYQKAKPANTYRIVLLGASNDMGTGVKNDRRTRISSKTISILASRTRATHDTRFSIFLSPPIVFCKGCCVLNRKAWSFNLTRRCCP